MVYNYIVVKTAVLLAVNQGRVPKNSNALAHERLALSIKWNQQSYNKAKY